MKGDLDSPSKGRSRPGNDRGFKGGGNILARLFNIKHGAKFLKRRKTILEDVR